MEIYVKLAQIERENYLTFSISEHTNDILSPKTKFMKVWKTEIEFLCTFPNVY